MSKSQRSNSNPEIDPTDKSNETYNMFCHPPQYQDGQNPTIFSTLFSGAGRSKMVTISINLSAHSEASKILLTPKRHLYIFKAHKAGPIAIDLFKDLFQSLHNRLLTPTADPQMGRKCRQVPLLKQKEMIKQNAGTDMKLHESVVIIIIIISISVSTTLCRDPWWRDAGPTNLSRTTLKVTGAMHFACSWSCFMLATSLSCIAVSTAVFTSCFSICWCLVVVAYLHKVIKVYPENDLQDGSPKGPAAATQINHLATVLVAGRGITGGNLRVCFAPKMKLGEKTWIIIERYITYHLSDNICHISNIKYQISNIIYHTESKKTNTKYH